MYFLFVPLLLAALGLPLSVIAAALCDGQNKPVLAAGWYEGWAASRIPTSVIPYGKLNIVTFTFATTTNNASQIALDAVSASALTQVVSDAHSHNTSVMLSIGGFTGSAYFSMAVTAENRTSFVNAIMDLVNQYNVDGVELDWEYPTQIEGCNTARDDDSANYLAFLQDLRQAIGKKKISAAVSVNTWNGPDGKTPMTDVSAYAQVLDYISIMNYDVFGAWSSTAGPNAPVNQTCAPTIDQDGCAVSAVSNWENAGFPSSKILLGVPAYGHSFLVHSANAIDPSTGKLNLFPIADTCEQPLGDGDPQPGSTPTVDQCGNPVKPGGVLAFSSLVTQGYLTANGTNAPGIDFTFDQCSETPFVYNKNTEVMVSYDNAGSFEIKGRFIKEHSMGGFNMWYIGGDVNDILLDSISSGIGIQQCS